MECRLELGLAALGALAELERVLQAVRAQAVLATARRLLLDLAVALTDAALPARLKRATAARGNAAVSKGAGSKLWS